MKTLQLLIEIDVPDSVTPNQINISSYQDGYFISANDDDGETIDIDAPDDGNLRYCSDPNAPSQIFTVWGIDDLESRAISMEAELNEDGEPVGKFKQLYDRSKFPETLRNIGHDHDANYGITWDTLDYYLNTYCLI